MSSQCGPRNPYTAADVSDSVPYIGCTIKALPEHQRIEAARVAVRCNPANAPLLHPVLEPMLALLPPQHIAGLTSKFWPAKGVRLTVSFLDNPDQATRGLILLHMNVWGQTANVVFTETAGVGQVRIARAESGYWSYLGTDILSIPQNQATTNFQGFTARTPESEYRRVPPHEAGHLLGFVHEHQRREEVARLDVQKTIAYFMRTQGWSEQMVRQQVLTPLNDRDLTALAADVRSIMCYGLPGEITIDGQPIPGGVDLDAEDHQLAARSYPKAVTPPPPPPPPPPSTEPHTMQLLDAAGQLLASYELRRLP
jgi:hypothetical protein